MLHRSSCGLSFVQLVNYRNHCKQKHNGDLNLLKCDLCDDVFTVESHLECHRESIHKDVSYDLSIFEDMLQEELTCPFCEEKFEAVSMTRLNLACIMIFIWFSNFTWISRWASWECTWWGNTLLPGLAKAVVTSCFLSNRRGYTCFKCSWSIWYYYNL